MENENKNYIEEFIKKFCLQKSRLFAFLAGCLTVLFSIACFAGGTFGSAMLAYMLCIFLSAMANIVYSLDIYGKNKFAGDILIGGIFAGLLGCIIRTIQLGVLFSLQYFITYFAYAFIFILLLSIHTKNCGNKKLLVTLLSISAIYSIFEIIRLSSIGIVFQGLSWSYYRIAEMFLFLDYIAIVICNQSDFAAFGETLGKYKTQIPSFKIMAAILAFIAIIAIAIGTALYLSKQSTAPTSTQPAVQDTSKQVPVKETPVNKAAGTVQSGGTTQPEATGSAASDAPAEQSMETISIGQTVSIENYDFTLNSVTFSQRVEPDNPPSWYTYYDAPANEVYIYVNASIKNNQKQSISCDEIYSVTADYDGGYTYRGFHIADDTDGDFTYANISTVEPLQTRGVHCLVSCPKEVESSGRPLFLTITLKDGSNYKYTIR